MAEDRILQCGECGVNFIWAVEEQAGMAPPPATCPMCRRLAPAPGQRRGVVKWFSRNKGYGFITTTDGTEIYVHKSGVAPGQPLPRAGDLTEFVAVPGERGVQAEQVTVLETAAPPEESEHP